MTMADGSRRWRVMRDGILSWVMLSVSVECDDSARALGHGMLHAQPERGSLAKIARMPKHRHR